MDYKQKYEQALERARAYNGYEVKNICEVIFPELKEPEDDRIRKSIIDLVEKQMPKSENKKWMIAWLEKQGDKKPTENRQETKPNGGIVYEDFNEGDGFYKVNLAYLSKSQVKLIEDLVASWQNLTNNTAEWSEEDERMLASFLHKVEVCDLLSNKESIWIKNKFKSIKDRVQPKQEWSDEDENLFDLLNTCVCHYINNPHLEYSKREKVSKEIVPFIERLKSINPHPHWKPSDEQMKALYSALNDAISLYSDKVSPLYEKISRTHFNVLESLYNDLKKL